MKADSKESKSNENEKWQQVRNKTKKKTTERGTNANTAAGTKKVDQNQLKESNQFSV